MWQGAPSFLLGTARFTFLSASLVILATLLAYVPPPLPIKSQLRIHSIEPPDHTPNHGKESRPRLPPGSYRTDARTQFQTSLRCGTMAAWRGETSSLSS